MQETTITLIRHGQTPGNLRRAYVGSADQPITPQGQEELRQLRQGGLYPPVQAVFASPMLRCRQTADLLYPEHSPRLIEDLRERCFGDFEGKTHDEIICLPGFESWGMNEYSMCFPGGEEQASFLRRCSEGFWQMVAICREEGLEEAAAVIHGGVIMSVLFQHAQPPGAYHSWLCGNGGGYRLRCDQGSQVITVLEKLPV